MQNALVVEPGRFGDQIELIGDRKFDIAVGVAEQLGELGLDRVEHDDLGDDGTEQRGGFLCGLRSGAADDLRHPGQFLDAVALNDPLGAECDLEAAAHPLEMIVDPVGGSGIERRAQHQKLPVAKIRQENVDALLNDMTFRIEKLIDRCADGDDDRPRTRNLAGLAGEDQAACRGARR